MHVPCERPGVQMKKNVDQSHEEMDFETVLNTLVLMLASRVHLP